MTGYYSYTDANRPFFMNANDPRLEKIGFVKPPYEKDLKDDLKVDWYGCVIYAPQFLWEKPMEGKELGKESFWFIYQNRPERIMVQTRTEWKEKFEAAGDFSFHDSWAEGPGTEVIERLEEHATDWREPTKEEYKQIKDYINKLRGIEPAPASTPIITTPASPKGDASAIKPILKAKKPAPSKGATYNPFKALAALKK